jgi:hypothetical protein
MTQIVVIILGAQWEQVRKIELWSKQKVEA